MTDHPASVDPQPLAPATSRVALRVAAATVAIFMLLSWADTATTNAGRSDGTSLELNVHLLDPSGLLGVRYWAYHLVLALMLAEFARRFVAGMADLLPHLDERRAFDIFSFRRDEGRSSWLFLLMVTDALLMGAIVEVNNVVEGTLGLGIAPMLRRVGTMVLGENADVDSYLHYPVIYTDAILAFLLLAPVSRAIARGIARAYPAIWQPVQPR